MSLVVVGSPGIGKSCLLFLLIRVLLEIGVKVLFSFAFNVILNRKFII
jgi:DNA replication protein DnaC